MSQGFGNRRRAGWNVEPLCGEDRAHLYEIVYWKFIAGALFFSACSLLPSLLG